MDGPVLTPEDIHSPAWLRVKAHMEARLASARIKNDNPLDEVRTARLRGAIAELKYLITLDAPPGLQEPDEEELFK